MLWFQIPALARIITYVVIGFCSMVQTLLYSGSRPELIPYLVIALALASWAILLSVWRAGIAEGIDRSAKLIRARRERASLTLPVRQQAQQHHLGNSPE